MYFFFTCAFLVSAATAAKDGTCPTADAYGQPACLSKDDYHPYWLRTKTFKGNGPCFDNGGEAVIKAKVEGHFDLFFCSTAS